MLNHLIHLLITKVKNIVKCLISNIIYKKIILKNNQVSEFKKNGYLVIDNFFTKQECNEIIEELNKIFNTSNKINISSDQADKRIFGAENISKKIHNFFCNKFIHQICESYLNYPIFNKHTMANCISYKKNNKGSGNGWHRDDINKTAKAMVYLSDVNLNNGYFEMIKNSNTFFNILRDHKYLNQKVDDIRFEEVKILKINKFYNSKNFVKLPAKAGTLILFDPSNLHRGHPILSGVRYALTNYYFNKYNINDKNLIPAITFKKKLKHVN